jgi:hypothetical protein
MIRHQKKHKTRELDGLTSWTRGTGDKETSRGEGEDRRNRL